MILAIDVYYIGDTAKAVGVLFRWKDEAPQQVLTLNQKNPIIGVAKNSFHANQATVKEVYRGRRLMFF